METRTDTRVGFWREGGSTRLHACVLRENTEEEKKAKGFCGPTDCPTVLKSSLSPLIVSRGARKKRTGCTYVPGTRTEEFLHVYTGSRTYTYVYRGHAEENVRSGVFSVMLGNAEVTRVQISLLFGTSRTAGGAILPWHTKAQHAPVHCGGSSHSGSRSLLQLTPRQKAFPIGYMLTSPGGAVESAATRARPCIGRLYCIYVHIKLYIVDKQTSSPNYYYVLVSLRHSCTTGLTTRQHCLCY